MNQSSFDDWLKLYGKAWTQKRPDLIRDLFTQRATYSEKPFEDPFEGIEEITRYWQKVSQSQTDISFDYKIICKNDNTGLAHFKASFLRKPDETYIKLDGIFKVVLNAQNKCTSFSEWWQSQKSKH